MIRYFSFLLFFVLSACSFPGSSRSITVGIDRSWYPLDFEKQQSYVNGYTEELLMKMSEESRLEFVLIDANWDSLVSGLKEKKYDAILSSLPPYDFNKAYFSFSNNFLALGPQLIVSGSSKVKKLLDFQGEMVGIIANDPAVRILEKYPSIIIRSYPSPTALLNALVKGELSGALLESIVAANYVHNLYRGVLKLVGGPIGDQGLHLVGKQEDVELFNRALKKLKEKKVIEKLQEKWQLR